MDRQCRLTHILRGGSCRHVVRYSEVFSCGYATVGYTSNLRGLRIGGLF